MSCPDRNYTACIENQNQNIDNIVVWVQLGFAPVSIITYSALAIYVLYKKAKRNLIFSLVITMLLSSIFKSIAWGFFKGYM
jgi:hypothetical protein